MKKEETATFHQNSLMDEHLSESIPSHLEYGGAVDISPFPSFGSPGLRKLYDRILGFQFSSRDLTHLSFVCCHGA